MCIYLWKSTNFMCVCACVAVCAFVCVYYMCACMGVSSRLYAVMYGFQGCVCHMELCFYITQLLFQFPGLNFLNITHVTPQIVLKIDVEFS